MRPFDEEEQRAHPPAAVRVGLLVGGNGDRLDLDGSRELRGTDRPNELAPPRTDVDALDPQGDLPSMRNEHRSTVRAPTSQTVARRRPQNLRRRSPLCRVELETCGSFDD